MSTIKEFLRARAGDPRTALRFEDQSWSYAEYVDACAQRAAYLLESRREGPFHVGVLLDNVPEFAKWLGAGALAGATVVGINPTHRGAELAREHHLPRPIIDFIQQHHGTTLVEYFYRRASENSQQNPDGGDVDEQHAPTPRPALGSFALQRLRCWRTRRLALLVAGEEGLRRAVGLCSHSRRTARLSLVALLAT